MSISSRSPRGSFSRPPPPPTAPSTVFHLSPPVSCSESQLSLDYIIDCPKLEWLPTEEEKVWYCNGVGIPKDRLS